MGASASDVASGNHDIVAGEFFIDSDAGNGTGSAMTLAVVAPSTTLVGTIPAATVAGLAVGTHTVTIHARDRRRQLGPAGERHAAHRPHPAHVQSASH